MSCFNIIESEDTEIVGECQECEGDINKDGLTVYDGCYYSSVDCETCGFQPCNLSC